MRVFSRIDLTKTNGLVVMLVQALVAHLQTMKTKVTRFDMEPLVDGGHGY
jgi:hypothetical protein